MNNDIAQFKTIGQIITQFDNNKTLKQMGNIIQIQNMNTGLYHYLVENMQGWNELPFTSISGEFFTHEIE